MKSSGYAVAVVGATGLVGHELIEVLEQRQFPITTLQLYASVRSAGDEVRCGAVSARVELLDSARFADLDIIFLAAGAQVTAEWLQRATDSGAVVIDTSQLFAGDADVPLVVAEVNAPDIAGYRDRSLIASPDAPAIALAITLSPLHAAATVRRVVACTLEPASSAGNAGIEELHRQTVELMSGRSVEPELFPQRIAFNAVPQMGELLAGGMSQQEQESVAAVRRLLAGPDLPVSLTRVRVPLFFGTSIALNVETMQSLSSTAARDLLRAAPGILLLEEVEPHALPTPADAVGQDATCVGRIRSDETANVLDLWIAMDNVRKGAAVNAVQIAERLIREYL